MNLIPEVLATVARQDIKDIKTLCRIHERTINSYINDIHLISYLNIFDIEKSNWLGETGGKPVFYTHCFSEEKVQQDWDKAYQYRESNKIKSLRHYLFEKGMRKYPILLITREEDAKEFYPQFNNILFQIPATEAGAERLARELEITKTDERENFLKTFLNLNTHFSNWQYIYYYITPIRRQNAVTGTSLFTSQPISQENLLNIIPLFDMLFAHLDLVLIENAFKNFSLRSAVATIMSRNMSHNIGSHVLARIATKGINGWTQNKSIREILDTISEGAREKSRSLVFWSKDAQILARYIQQRMDFIAQVSANLVNWTESAYLVKNLMRWFLSQKHLLNFIAASENLRAHTFTEKKTTEPDNFYGDIRLHIFLTPEAIWKDPISENSQTALVENRLKQNKSHCALYPQNPHLLGCSDQKKCSIAQPSPLGDESIEENSIQWQNPCRRILLFTPERGEAECQVDEDILLAIPGGLVGYHAFFVILENVIRNAAKHGYTKEKSDHLDVVIEIYHDPEERIGIQSQNKRKVPAWLLRIYDNVSFVNEGENSRAGVLLWGRNEGEKGINEILGSSFITETGDLKKEDWGLAEIKIAAGYLQRRTISMMGRTGEAITGARPGKFSEDKLDDELWRLASADTHQGSEAVIRAVKSPIGTLGYEFYIPRPRTVGILYEE